jgi:hypothetical protein
LYSNINNYEKKYLYPRATKRHNQNFNNKTKKTTQFKIITK